MNKILSIRIMQILGISFALVACGAGPEKRVNNDEGPFSARARNTLATENPEGLLRVGQGFEQSGNLQSALNIYGQAMAAAPELIEAQIAYARVTGLLGAHDRSIAMLSALLEKHPKNAAVRSALAQVNIRLGRFKLAMLVMKPLLDAESASADTLDLGGRLAQIGSAPGLARSYFGRALDLQPQNSGYLRNMALSFALEGEYQTSVAMLQKSMDKAAGLMPGRQSLALVYALSGQYSSALQLARGSMSLEEVNRRKFIYRNIATWTKQQQAMALLFDQYPTDLLTPKANASK
ncbi:MAG: tetratricopeptide repeat protein [Kordiimonas sp.]